MVVGSAFCGPKHMYTIFALSLVMIMRGRTRSQQGEEDIFTVSFEFGRPVSLYWPRIFLVFLSLRPDGGVVTCVRSQPLLSISLLINHPVIRRCAVRAADG
jgi:hypothetical protein